MKEARQIIADAGPDSTVDALGLGTPVELISDLLFPGTSTLHTELRYVIFVPAILYAIKEQGGVNNSIKTLKIKENELINSLKNSGLKEGVIGRTRGIELKYWPSTTYWAGINSYKTLGPVYYDRGHVLDLLNKTDNMKQVSDDGENVSQIKNAFLGDDQFFNISKTLFKDFKKIQWPDKMTFNLRKVEAKFLYEQIHTYHNESMYTELLKSKALSLRNVKDFFSFKKARPDLTNLIQECHNYSKLAMGTTYAYRWALCDHIVSERKTKEGKHDWVIYRDHNAKLYNEWIKNNKDLKNWDISYLTEAIIKAFSKPFATNLIEKSNVDFCNQACEIMFSKANTKQTLTTLGKLTKEREKKLKGNKSRFIDASITIPENVKATSETPYNNTLYTYRWDWGLRNSITILEGLNIK